MSRRVLLKGLAQLSLLLILPSQRVTGAAVALAPAQARAYGQGAYNQGSYPGDQHIYLPLVNKEEH